MKNANQPAMPTIYADMAVNGQREIYCDQVGLTKREHFAAMAMQAMLGNSRMEYYPTDLVKEAIVHADALLAELDK